MKHITAASIMGNQQIAKYRPDCIIVQSESAEYIHEMRAVESDEIRLTNKLRFLSLDLLYAHPLDAEVLLYCLDNGMTRQELDWFMAGEPPGYPDIPRPQPPDVPFPTHPEPPATPFPGHPEPPGGPRA